MQGQMGLGAPSRMHLFVADETIDLFPQFSDSNSTTPTFNTSLKPPDDPQLSLNAMMGMSAP